MSSSRYGYIDWMRGLAVLIMIEAHTMDAWTQAADRQRLAFAYAIILGGFGAPLFLFLAGVGVALSAGSKARKTGSDAAAASAVQRRGWQIFGLAFLFRLQAYVFGRGAVASALLKVDILNILGLGMIAAAVLWGAFKTTAWRLGGFAAAAITVTMMTPLVRSVAWLDWLPDPVEWYLRPSAGNTNFTLLPWAGFVFAGGFVGVLIDPFGKLRVDGEQSRTIDRARTSDEQWRLVLGARSAPKPTTPTSQGIRDIKGRALGWLGFGGAAMAILSYRASFLPSIYAESDFWTSAPTFFFLRVGILLAAMAAIYVWCEKGVRRDLRRLEKGVRPLFRPMEVFGQASLFVYWVHVELVYGVPSLPLHRNLSIEHALIAFTIFTLLMFALAMLKTRLVDLWRERRQVPPVRAPRQA